jgi:Glycoside hydrolase family 2 C-terminal domain 5
VGASRRAYQGRLMAVVRSNGQPGEIALSACAEGLISAHTRIQAR